MSACDSEENRDAPTNTNRKALARIQFFKEKKIVFTIPIVRKINQNLNRKSESVKGLPKAVRIYLNYLSLEMTLNAALEGFLI